jgi:L-ascorbate metabolism protein UlaG (beta-lactamase superfamily)
MRVTYIGHSGFSVELESHILLFDYYEGTMPEFDPAKKLLVFASHSHPDHFNREILKLADVYPDVEYIFPKDIGIAKKEQRVSEHFMRKRDEITVGDTKVKSLRSTDEGVAFLVRCEDRIIYHAGDLNWWHWEGEDPVWNRNMEADFRRYAEPLRGRKIDLAMLPLDPRLGEDGFRGPRYFLELADIRRFLPMHQWGNFNFTNQFLSCYTSFTSRTVYVNRVGQVFTFEEEADT